MKKGYILLLSSLLLGGMLASCTSTPEEDKQEQKDDDKPSGDEPGGDTPSGDEPGGDTPGGDEPGGDTPAHEDEEEEDYVIRVNAPETVHYTVSHQRAKKGTEVTFTITSIDEGYTLKQVTLNGNALNGENNVFTFTMPNQSALIAVALNATGDVTIFGDIAATLVKEGDIYVARNVKVETNGLAYFSYKVKDVQGVEHVLGSGDLDENKCFADVTFAYGHEEELQIASNCTYDFFYDPSAQFPCYIQRVSVDYLPSDEKGLFSLFDGSYRSESTVNYPGLKGISYSVTDRSDAEEVKKYTSEWKLYENNVAFMKVVDIMQDDREYYAYKAYDEENHMLEVVDTFTKAYGNNDRTRGDYNLYGAYSARFDVVELDSDSNGRREVSKREAMHMVNQTAHYGRYLESEIQDCYRVGYSLDELKNYELNIESEKNGDDLVTSVTGYKEYDSTAGTYTSEMHEAYVYDVTLTFDAAGKVKNVNYLETKYTKSQWNFTSHQPNVGQEGSIYKRLNVTYTYGAPEAGAPEFDKDKYFIQSIDNIQFFNESAGVEDDGASHLHYADKVYIGKRDKDDKHETLKALSYSPATALDVWEYGPVASTDENVVGHLNTDYFDQMTCNGVGTATVTFGNFTKSSGIKKDIDINVHATQKFHSIYIYSTWGGYAGDTISSEKAQVVAGQETSFKVAVTPSTAPVIYNAVSENTNLLTIKETGQKLTVDTTGAANITKATTVKVYLTSTWYQDWIQQNKYFEFVIIPQAANPVGSRWGVDGETHAVVEFTSEDYTGTISSYYADQYEGAKLGHIIDDGNGGYTKLDIDFYYVFKKGQIYAKITKVNKAEDPDGYITSTHQSDFALDFYYEADTDRLGVGLAYQEYDSEIEDYYIYDIYGVYDEGSFTEYLPFDRLSA